MTTWKLSINGDPAVNAASIGLKVLGGTFVSHGSGSVRLELDADFDGASPLVYNDAVEIIRSDAGELDLTVFRGRCKTVPRYGLQESEGMILEIRDAWADMEETVYLEEWPAYLPAEGGYDNVNALLDAIIGGLNPDGTARTTSQLIQAAVSFAIGAGVPLQMGNIPAGMRAPLEEIKGRTCSEIILKALTQHPHWMTWMDYSTSPATLHFVDRSTATARTLLVDGTGNVADFDIVRRDDLVPRRVILSYETAGGIPGVVGVEAPRGIIEDIYPPPPGIGTDPLPLTGPGVIRATLPLATIDEVKATSTPPIVDRQYARIQTRPIPADKDDANAKTWIKKKYRHLQDIPDAAFAITDLVRDLDEWGDDVPEPVNPAAVPANPVNAGDIPNELVAGQIEDWMDAETGRVRVVPKIRATSSATEAQRKEIAKILPACIVVATNKTTGLYQRVVSWTPGSSTAGTPAAQAAPMLGLAQAYFEQFAETAFEGTINLANDEIPRTRFAGCRINLTGGLAEWATMDALVASVQWAADAGSTSIQIGPPRWQSFADFIALQQALRGPVESWKWTDKRNDVETAGTGGGSSEEIELDNVQGFTSPETIFEPIEIPDPAVGFKVLQVYQESGTWKAKLAAGLVVGRSAKGGAAEPLKTIEVASSTQTITSSSKIYLKVVTDKWDFPTSAEIHVATSDPASTHAQPDPSGATGTYYYRIADFEVVDGTYVALKNQYHLGILQHVPQRVGRNLKVVIKKFSENTEGKLTTAGSDEFMFFRDGMYVGLTDPGDGAAQDERTVAQIQLGS